jgi:hypothetical protein
VGSGSSDQLCISQRSQASLVISIEQNCASTPHSGEGIKLTICEHVCWKSILAYHTYCLHRYIRNHNHIRSFQVSRLQLPCIIKLYKWSLKSEEHDNLILAAPRCE